MKFKNYVIAKFAMSAFIALLSFNAFAQSAPPVQATFFGMHKFSPAQTAAVSVVNRRPASEGEIIPCIRVAIIADVYETSSYEFTKLQFSRRVIREERLEAGDALNFNFQPSRTGDSAVNVSVFVYPEEAVASPEIIRSAVFSTVQVTENGRALYTLPGVVKGFDPQPDPPAAK